MTIYVGNLSYRARENDLSDLFSEFGTVSSVKIISDNATGRSKGFGFIEMEDENAGNEAIESLHETEFMERKLIVNKARPKRENFDGDRGGYNRD
ncbi:MAG: RNA-binding protein [Chitinophagaceae bacterium]|nr:MAG: RNA-binding protein [Chitinophagaceae bacterium]